MLYKPINRLFLLYLLLLEEVMENISFNPF